MISILFSSDFTKTFLSYNPQNENNISYYEVQKVNFELLLLANV